jgi:diguanylate cyclase (GGDEF)-like protein/PAS domain S-box-containing protein
MFWEKSEIGQVVFKKLSRRVEAWEDGLSGSRIPYRYRPRIRAQQIEKFRTMLPYSLAGNAISAFLLFCALAPTQDMQTLSFWLATLLLLSVVGLKTTNQIKPDPARHRAASKRRLRRPYTEITMMAAAWAVAPIFFLPLITDHQLAIMMTVGAGTMAGGAFLISPIPRAAGLFVTVFGAGFLIGFTNRSGGAVDWTLMGLLLAYGLVMFRATYWNFGNHVEAWLHQFKLEEQAGELQQQKDMISVLLKDFEESASDVLWQIDKDGRFFEVSEELAGFFGLPVKVLEKLTIWRIFDQANLIEQSSLKALVACLESQHAFSDRVISHRHMGRELFWNISAKPVYANGNFDGFRGVLADVTEAQNASSRISYLAHYDPLTDLPNRSFFGETLERCLYAQQTEDEAFCVIALDLDFFKAVNDAHGHDIGDKLLRRAAQLMRTCLQEDDYVARIGGDEFAIIQRHIKTRGQTMALCDHLVEVMSRPITIEGIDLQIGVSMGVAFCPFDTLDMGDLQKFADLALYKSKQEGRGCVRYFKQDMDDAAQARRKLEADLKKALKNGEFELHYQPVLDAHTSKVMAYEALLRWNHPERGLVSPIVL